MAGGENKEPFIIAEAGINHNGELEKALAMINVAKEAGADAIKFQTFKADEFVADDKLTYTYRSQGEFITESMLAMFKRCEFTRSEWKIIKNHCDEIHITFLSTPQNKSDLDLLMELGVSAVKVGSDDFNNLPLLKCYAQTGLPLLLSCGMADLAEVYRALDTIGTFDGYPTALMLCTSQYPTPPEDVNLLKLRTLSAGFPMVTLGFSDHTQGTIASTMAIAFGATVFEKHFTMDHNLPGPDHWFSEDPLGLMEWVNNIRIAHKMLGSNIIRPTLEEDKNRKEFRRVIVTAKDIKEGEIFTEDNLTMRRIPGGRGFSPEFLQMLLGKQAWKDIHKGEPIVI